MIGISDYYNISQVWQIILINTVFPIKNALYRHHTYKKTKTVKNHKIHNRTLNCIKKTAVWSPFKLSQMYASVKLRIYFRYYIINYPYKTAKSRS